MADVSNKVTEEEGNKTNEENEQKMKTEENQDDEDIFKGDLEDYKEVEYYGKKDYTSPSAEVIENNINAAMIKNKRPFYKYIIARPKKEFEAYYPFSDKEPGAEGSNLDVKPAKITEYPTTDKEVLEIELQTANESSDKAYQVPRVRLQNSFTNSAVDIDEIVDKYQQKASFYLTNNNR